MRSPRVLTALLMLLAAGSACQRQEERTDRPRALPADVHLPVEALLVQGIVPRRTTLHALLLAHGLEEAVAGRVVEAAADVFDPRRLRSLQPFQLERTLPGALRRFEYEIDAGSFLRVRAEPDSPEVVTAEILPIPRTLEMVSVAGGITQEASSLFASMTAAGEGGDLALALAAVFSGEIDFNSEVQLGDRYTVVFERFRREGRPNTYGVLHAAEYVDSAGRVLRAIRFAPPGSPAAYYDQEGRSQKRFFLKSPLKFEPRVTSGFSLRRRHPVLHTSRAHRGVDYGAPHGAPVVAVSPGTVVSATYDSANGRMIRLRHASGYQTYYLHLSRFAQGVRAGGRVEQGEVIGYVGSTGLSTGPHLHYGLTRNGVFVNPIAEHRRMPPGEPVPASAMEAFRVVRDKALADLDAVSPRRSDAVASR